MDPGAWLFVKSLAIAGAIYFLVRFAALIGLILYAQFSNPM